MKWVMRAKSKRAWRIRIRDLKLFNKILSKNGEGGYEWKKKFLWKEVIKLKYGTKRDLNDMLISYLNLSGGEILCNQPRKGKWLLVQFKENITWSIGTRSKIRFSWISGQKMNHLWKSVQDYMLFQKKKKTTIEKLRR